MGEGGISMKIMYKSAALAAALILTAGISVQAQYISDGVVTPTVNTNDLTATGTTKLDTVVISEKLTVQNQLNANKAVVVDLNAENVNAGSLTVNGKDVSETLSAHTNAIQGLQQQTQSNLQNITQANQARIEADNKLQSQIEVNGYKADTALKLEGNGVLYNHGTNLTTGINLNTSAIEQEEKDRVAADKNLQGQIDTNASNIGALDNQINGDNGLAEKVEVNGYKADTALKLEGNGVLYNHGTDLTTGINLNTSAIEQEEKDRVAADLQLQQGIQNNSNAISSLNSRVSDLGGEIDNVGAISAALAGLHPLDYNGTGSKFQLAAAMGDYDGSQAAAIGGFYHFNEDVMMSVGGATAFDGDKKAAFNVGVSFRVGRSSSAKRLNSDDVIAQLEAMNNKIAALEAENQKLTEKVAALQDSEAAQKA